MYVEMKIPTPVNIPSSFRFDFKLPRSHRIRQRPLNPFKNGLIPSLTGRREAIPVPPKAMRNARVDIRLCRRGQGGRPVAAGFDGGVVTGWDAKGLNGDLGFESWDEVRILTR